MSDARSTTILIIDDTPFAATISDALRAADYMVTTAVSGRDALIAIAGNCPSLILLDIDLPDVSGIDLCQIVRRHVANMPFIILITHETTATVTAGLDAGANDCISKSCDSRELLARVRAVLRRASAIRPSFQS